ncbi:MAG: hypothetical protein IJ524_09905 [Bacteroidales bacterium]|nr:hypothetical protein [Bacteroidales bacterium]
MISIIICSRESYIPRELQQNIAETIGNDYELVVIDNSLNQYSIFQAYNLGVQQAKGDILCFCHNDIKFLTPEWGKIVHDYFSLFPKLGCLGVAGSHVMFNCPSSFWQTSFLSIYVQYIYPDGRLQLCEEREPSDENRRETQVVTVDGLWMCIRKELFKTVKFDEINFHGFHCYDSDICMQIINSNYEIIVTYQILIQHKANVELDISYYNAIETWHRKWTNHLPIIRGITIAENDIKKYTSFVTSQISLDKQILQLKKEPKRMCKNMYSLFLKNTLRYLKNLFYKHWSYIEKNENCHPQKNRASNI